MLISNYSVINYFKAFEKAGGAEVYEQALKQEKPPVNTDNVKLSQTLDVTVTFIWEATMHSAPLVMQIQASNGWNCYGTVTGVVPKELPDPINTTLSYENWDLLKTNPMPFVLRSIPGQVGSLDIVFVRGELIFGVIGIGFFMKDAELVGGKGNSYWFPPQYESSWIVSSLEAIERAGGSAGFKKSLEVPDKNLPISDKWENSTEITLTFDPYHSGGIRMYTINVATDNGQIIGTGFAHNVKSGTIIGPVSAKLEYNDWVDLIKEPVIWKIQNIGVPGGLGMPIVRGDVAVGYIRLGFYLKDAGLVGALGTLVWRVNK
ncbi:hypothetical protein FRC02_005940 [Tulasnella sp. 418]|nr:hypothetical protein FRC02_005940 [Tulasnella sp. 418]